MLTLTYAPCSAWSSLAGAKLPHTTTLHMHTESSGTETDTDTQRLGQNMGELGEKSWTFSLQLNKTLFNIECVRVYHFRCCCRQAASVTNQHLTSDFSQQVLTEPVSLAKLSRDNSPSKLICLHWPFGLTAFTLLFAPKI